VSCAEARIRGGEGTQLVGLDVLEGVHKMVEQAGCLARPMHEYVRDAADAVAFARLFAASECASVGPRRGALVAAICLGGLHGDDHGQIERVRMRGRQRRSHNLFFIL
jgi:hypothetical protein